MLDRPSCLSRLLTLLVMCAPVGCGELGGVDTSNDGESSGAAPEADPAEGAWFYAEGLSISDTCMLPGWSVNASTEFLLTNNGDGSFTVLREGQNIECDINGDNFSCLPVALEPVTVDALDVVFNLDVTYSGVFDSNTEITGQRQLGYVLESGTFDTEEGRELLESRSHLADVSLDELRVLPDETLGREWVRFLDDHHLSVETTKQPTPWTDDDERAYVLHRIRQSHDLWHVLLGVGTSGHEEVLVHSFSLAQTGLPCSVAIVALGAIKHMVLEQRWDVLRHQVMRAHRIGVHASPLLAVFWERHLDEPLEDIRRRLGLTPLHC